MKKLIDDALDSMDDVRGKLNSILNQAEGTEGADAIVACINDNASKFINANMALEDVLSAIEDLESD